MKKVVLFVFFLAALSLSSSATDKRLNLYGAYVFDDEVSSYYDPYTNYYYGKIKAGFQYGAGIEFMPSAEVGAELLWIGQTTTAPISYMTSNYFQEQNIIVDLNLNYAMLAVNRYGMSQNQKVEGYGGFMLGALFASAKKQEGAITGDDSATKFAWGLRLGANIWASPKVGFKIQGMLLSAVQAVGGSLYFGTGGAGGGVSTYSSMLQCSVGGGLVFNLGGK